LPSHISLLLDLAIQYAPKRGAGEGVYVVARKAATDRARNILGFRSDRETAGHRIDEDFGVGDLLLRLFHDAHADFCAAAGGAEGTVP
jgi:hypothetical protein